MAQGPDSQNQSGAPGPGPSPPRRAFFVNWGFLTNRRHRRILHLAGYRLARATPWHRPGAHDAVVVWGHSPLAARGAALAQTTGSALIRVEDAFLRSLHPGRAGDPPVGLVIDRQGAHFDASQPSDLEDILAHHPLDDTALLDRARRMMARIAQAQLSKYSATDPDLAPPEPGYVLVIDQAQGDAAIGLGGADADTFREMLYWAAEDHPGARIVIKTHPETERGLRPGHFTPEILSGYGDRVQVLSGPFTPATLFEGAVAVYTVTSQTGFEAILAGHRPVVFGQPFYVGWDLTDDRRPVARRGRRLTRAQLAAAALILYPVWYDPYRDRLGEIEDALGALEAMARAWREDRNGYLATGISAWKRPHLRRFFGAGLRFRDPPEAVAAKAPGPVLVWASRAPADLAPRRGLARIEDGMLRSHGLGAALTPPLSLVRDDLGIYYDPTRESRLERLVAEAARMSASDLTRARDLIAAIRHAGLSKYNRGAASPLPALPGTARILVAGQVEDDASIRLGAAQIATNRDLLLAARAAFPQAALIYKPHPDVEAGLRPGTLAAAELDALADHVTWGADPAALLDQVDRVVTITSGLGWEALLRDLPVTCFGTPFYAGWGLTDDRGPVPARRQARPSIEALAHAVLIAYPRYLDPVTGLPCPPEVAVARLAQGVGFRPGPRLWALARLQALRPRR